MADIDIVPKHRSRAWLWTILAIALLFIIIWLMMSGGNAPRTGVFHDGPVESVADLRVAAVAPPVA
jgi:hypothetical protein